MTAAKFLIWLYCGLFTFHGNSPGANDIHRPMGIEIQYNQSKYGYLWFVNSFGDPSWTIYRTGETKNKTIRLNYLAGMVDGYTGGPGPFIIPIISARYGSLLTDFSCLPNSTGSLNCAITFKMMWSDW